MDQPHVFTGDFWSDREEWELLFFKAYLADDPAALEQLARASSVEGFGHDEQHLEYQRYTPRAP